MVGAYARARGKRSFAAHGGLFDPDKTVIAKSSTLTFSKSFY
jgi:hypothetical protein